MYKHTSLFTCIFLLIVSLSSAQVINVGSGSYTKTFPGKDEAGRNDFPSGSPQLSGIAVGKPVPTNDWWSKLIKENFADNLYNYPLSMKTIDEGLVVGNIVPVSTPNGSSQPFGDGLPVIIGVSDLNAGRTTVSNYSDWTVTMNWQQGSHDFSVTSGIGMPFLYFEKGASDIAQIKVNEGSVTIEGAVLVIQNSQSGSNYAVYAPDGSQWTKVGSTYTSDLTGKNYWSMARLPDGPQSLDAKVDIYHAHAFVFPKNTITRWDYDKSTANVSTEFSVETEIKEGQETEIIMGLLPHQWGNLADDSNQPNDLFYSTIRGELKVVEGNHFKVEHSFKGILPTLPYLNNYSEGFDPALLNSKIVQIENDGLATWTDSYNEGQVMNRLIQSARVADEMGNLGARDKMIQTIKERLEDWLKVQSGEVAFLYYYNTAWTTLIGYPAGHGQDNNINDHHFHWGYFIHAAAFMEQFEPGWAEEWGGMVDLLIRDAASPNRDDELFPFLRNFSPYAGHSWANGFATFPFGNDQESTSESMQFASSLIHWGTITENDDIRDLGIYIYTTEQAACEEYWFDIHNRTFKDGYGYKLASRIWGNGYDNQTFWTSDIAAAYGIEMYPIHGGSLYLGHQKEYAESLWNEISSNTGILSNEENPNLWHDTYWKYLSFIYPQAAIDLYDSYPDRNLKFGISDVQTYHWLHSMNVLGTVNTDITSDYPIAASFTKDGEVIYVAHNYGDNAIVVKFSDGFELDVPANELVTSRDVSIDGLLTSDFSSAFPGGSVGLTVNINGGDATKVEFFDGSTYLGMDELAPFEFRAENLSLGIHGMFAKVYVDDDFNTTNIVSIQVGEQKPYDGVFEIPGVIEGGNYDAFEGGLGQNISYLDLSPGNNGNYRLDEYVDCELKTQEGPTVGWINAGEWLEYSIRVENSGYYDVSFRFASGNPVGGGPFHFEVDGQIVSDAIQMEYTNGWDNWKNKVLKNVALTKGEHVLRLVVSNGEFNLGRMTFTFADVLDYSPPYADAGENVTVQLPMNSTQLDGSMSNDPEGESIEFEWHQVYGPSIVDFDDMQSSQPTISSLVEGVYKFELLVSDGTYEDQDVVLVIVSSDGNLPPTVSITSPGNNTTYKEGETIDISATASDIDGTITRVEFFDGIEKIGEDISAPFAFSWEGAEVGIHSLSAVAIDNAGAQGSSQPVEIEIAEVKSCFEMDNEALQGSFSVGYEAKFETVGSNVTMTFTLLDTDKIGVVAFLWQEWPFTEYQMNHVSGLTFSKTFGGYSIGDQLTFACKFAFAGGLAVTKYIDYTVGEDCEVTSVLDETSTSIDVFPNPVQDVLWVKGLTKTTNASIYSSTGIQMNSVEVVQQIDISELPQGIYFISFAIDDKSVVKKFVKN